MKVQLFKNLIKESVREVLKEELREILSEYNLSSTPSSKSQPVASSMPTEVKVKSNFPISSLESVLNETRQSMTSSDFKNIMDGGVNTPSFENTPTDTSNFSPTGLDISNLSFVKNAAAVYNLANEKSKR